MILGMEAGCSNRANERGRAVVVPGVVLWFQSVTSYSSSGPLQSQVLYTGGALD